MPALFLMQIRIETRNFDKGKLDMSTLVKKLATRTVYGDKEIIRDKAKEVGAEGRIHVMRAFGIVTGIKNGESINGPWVAFKGEFKCVNPETGDDYIGGTLYLPDVASDMVESAFIMANQGDVKTKAMEIAFDIFARYDNTAAVGYVFEAAPLKEQAEADPLALLEASLNDKPLALENKSKKGKEKAA